MSTRRSDLQVDELKTFSRDVCAGLSSYPKYLSSKYFYDDTGSKIFRQIMQMPEYYLTDCELEIFQTQGDQIICQMIADDGVFNLVELGSGDGSKTEYLLSRLVNNRQFGKFVPIDISQKANDMLLRHLKNVMPQLKVEALTGDYFHEMHVLSSQLTERKVVLFLGSNIGNFDEYSLHLFLSRLSKLMQKGDQVLIGFDLKKTPEIVLPAYDDPHGHTARFNLNLLTRINRELDADFNTEAFAHVTHYDPVSGELKSFLVAQDYQEVCVGSSGDRFIFERDEPVFMELSRKYDLTEIEQLAHRYGFQIQNNFLDSRQYFTDSLWVK